MHTDEQPLVWIVTNCGQLTIRQVRSQRRRPLSFVCMSWTLGYRAEAEWVRVSSLSRSVRFSALVVGDVEVPDRPRSPCAVRIREFQ